MSQPSADPVKDLMFRSLAKAKLLKPEEELALSRQCRSQKIGVWREILSDIAKLTSPNTIKIIKILPIMFVLNMLNKKKINIYGMTILSECYILFNIIEYK